MTAQQNSQLGYLYRVENADRSRGLQIVKKTKVIHEPLLKSTLLCSITHHRSHQNVGYKKLKRTMTRKRRSEQASTYLSLSCRNALLVVATRLIQVYNNGMIGIMLHRSCNDGIIANNVVYDNLDAGVALFETANTEVYGNTFTNNKCEPVIFSWAFLGLRSFQGTAFIGRRSC